MKQTSAEITQTNPLLTELNAEQRAAVTHGDGPLLIIAGAGTGKTKVITHRIAWLIKEGKAKPEEILALTFTEKAAGEMQGRLFDLELKEVPSQISTFHAFGDALLREYCYEVGLPAEFSLMGEAEQVIFLDELLFDLPLEKLRGHGRPAGSLQALAKVFSRAKNENKSPDDYAAWVTAETARVKKLTDADLKADAEHELVNQREIAAAFRVYEHEKDQRQLVDYADQVFKATRLIGANDVIRKRLHKQYKYVLVDEFQDTNVVQSQLVNLIAGTDGNLNVVGDDDQSIFGFQGAAIGNILGFEQTHPKAERVVLTENYRSTQPILDASYRLIGHNRERLESADGINKKLHAQTAEGPKVTLLKQTTADDEAERVADYIAKKRVSNERLPFAEMAILVRLKSQIDAFARALSARKIPYLAEGTGKLFDQPEIKMCVNFLRSVSSILDSPALMYVALSRSYGFPGEDMHRLARTMQLTHRDLWELLAELDPGEYSEKAIRVAGKLREDFAHAMKLAPDLPAHQLLFDWLERTGYLKQLRIEGDPEAEHEAARQARNLAKMFERLKQFARTAQDNTAAGWIKHYDDIIAIEDESVAIETDAEYDAVRILTIHAAKGLEFEIVFITGCVNQRFPRNFSRNPIHCNPLLTAPPEREGHKEEERRLFYVGMTRAKQELFLNAASDYGTKRAWKLSDFVKEAIGPEQMTALPEGPVDPLQRLAQSRPVPILATEYSPPERIKLAFTSFTAYQTCPLKYYWNHVIGLQGDQTFTMQYGTLLHQVIQQLNLAKQHGRKVTLEELLGWYEERWVSERFISTQHEAMVREQGKQTLTRFFAEEQDRAPATAVEEEFEFPLTGCSVKVKYDRIDRHKGAVTIVDYKTGKVRTQAEADKRAADKRDQGRQLTLYALGHYEQTGILPDQVVFNYVDSGLAGVSTRSEKDIEQMRQELIETAAQIRAGDFVPSRKPHECNPFADCPGHRVQHRTETWKA